MLVAAPHIAVTISEPTLEALIAANHPADVEENRLGGGPIVMDRATEGVGLFGAEPGADASNGHIPACVDYSMLQDAAPALWSSGTPIPPAQATKLLCGGEFHRIVFGPESEVLDSGRTRRLFTAAQTRAVIARDGHCQFPECTAPPEQGEIHHSIWWYHQGRTSIDNAILLCWYHHDYVHQHHISITATAQGWTFRRSDGRTINSTPAPAAVAGWTIGTSTSKSAPAVSESMSGLAPPPGGFGRSSQPDWTAPAHPARFTSSDESPARPQPLQPPEHASSAPPCPPPEPEAAAPPCPPPEPPEPPPRE